jgi:hypothetical protein
MLASLACIAPSSPSTLSSSDFSYRDSSTDSSIYSEEEKTTPVLNTTK